MTRSFGNLVDISVNEDRGDDDDDDPIHQGQMKIDIRRNQSNLAGGIGIDIYEGPEVDINIQENALHSTFGLYLEFGDDDDDGPFGISGLGHNAAIDVYIGEAWSWQESEGSYGENDIRIANNLVQTPFLTPDGIRVGARHSAPTNVEVLENTVRNVHCLTCRIFGDDPDDDDDRDPTSLRGISVSMHGLGEEDDDDDSSRIQNTLAINRNTVEFVGSPLANIIGGGPILVGDASVAGPGDDDDFHDYGIYANVSDSLRTQAEINDNTVYGINGMGIGAIFQDSHRNSVEINRNHVDATGDAGIALEADDNYYFEAEIKDNHVTRSLARGGFTDPNVPAGIGLFVDSTYGANFVIESNIVEDVGLPFGGGDDDDAHGVLVEVRNSDENVITLEHNEISRTNEHGIEIDLEDASDGNTIEINHNTVRVAGGNGVDIWVGGSSDVNLLSIGGNSIQYVEDGFQIDENTGNTYLNSDSDNEVLFYDDDAVDLDGTFNGYIEVNGYEYN